MKMIINFLKDENGATAIEYGLIAALISLALIAGAKVLGPAINSTFNTAGTTMNGAQPG